MQLARLHLRMPWLCTLQGDVTGLLLDASAPTSPPAPLQAAFAENEYPNTAAKTALAEELGVEAAQVRAYALQWSFVLPVVPGHLNRACSGPHGAASHASNG